MDYLKKPIEEYPEVMQYVDSRIADVTLMRYEFASHCAYIATSETLDWIISEVKGGRLEPFELVTGYLRDDPNSGPQCTVSWSIDIDTQNIAIAKTIKQLRSERR